VYEHGPFKFSYVPTTPDNSSSSSTHRAVAYRRLHHARKLAATGKQHEGQLDPQEGSSVHTTGQDTTTPQQEQGGGIVLGPNPFSWSKAATVIYIDSPVSEKWAVNSACPEVCSCATLAWVFLVECTAVLLAHALLSTGQARTGCVFDVHVVDHMYEKDHDHLIVLDPVLLPSGGYRHVLLPQQCRLLRAER
jgi:hypothetical protein